MSRSTQKLPERVTITDRKWKLTFGRWKGYTLEEVMGCDPHYVRWMSENTDHDIHSSLMDELDEDDNQARGLMYGSTFSDRA